MIKVSYFPGCTLRTKAKQLDLYARRCAEVLGVELCEIEDWQCCGGYVALEDPDSAKKKSNAVTNSAESHGAELAVTACPLCKYNLVHNGSNIPVVYFTELLAEALGVKEDINA